MGYQRKTVANLHFDDHPVLAGLEVKVRSTSLAEYFDLIEKIEASENGRVTTQAVFDAFCDKLIDWNLEDDDGTPVPATRDGFMEFGDFVMMDTVSSAWFTSLRTVPRPLDERSTDGSVSAPPSIPMEPVSPNQQN